jgi:hypothetical protein
MDVNFVSVDNFYEDPYKVRDIALNSEYYEPGYSIIYKDGAGPFSGVTSKTGYTPKEVDSTVCKIMQRNFRRRNYNVEDNFYGRFRITKGDQVAKNEVHVDSFDKNHWAGVLYLCDRPDIPGTIMYHHKERKISSVNDRKTLHEIAPDFYKKEPWEPITVSHAVFNRLIIFRANMFHGIGPTFGNDFETARIVQLFYWIDIT